MGTEAVDVNVHSTPQSRLVTGKVSEKCRVLTEKNSTFTSTEADNVHILNLGKGEDEIVSTPASTTLPVHCLAVHGGNLATG